MQPLTADEANTLIEDWPNSPACPCCGGKLKAGALLCYMLLRIGRSHGDIANIYPFLGAVEAFEEDGTLRLQHRWLFRWLVRRFYRYCSKAIHKFGDRPGINDQLMIKWLITRKIGYVSQLFDRAKRQDDVGWSCRWMLHSVRVRIPQLDWQLKHFGEVPPIGEFPAVN